MGMKKFLLIPVLIILYLTIGINFLMRFDVGFGTEAKLDPHSTGEQIGMGDRVVISVTRPYLLGLIRLPVYSGTMGDISWVHRLFFTFIGVMTAAFTFMEFSGFRIRLKDNSNGQSFGSSDINAYQDDMVKSQKSTRKGKSGGKNNMARNWDWKGWLMALGKGIVFGFITYVIGGDGALGVGLGLLVTYLEMKMK